jgi:hypothetical protein
VRASNPTELNFALKFVRVHRGGGEIGGDGGGNGGFMGSRKCNVQLGYELNILSWTEENQKKIVHRVGGLRDLQDAELKFWPAVRHFNPRTVTKNVTDSCLLDPPFHVTRLREWLFSFFLLLHEYS